MENCNIDDSIVNILNSQGQDAGKYYLISCTNKGISDDKETFFGERWGGAFPKILFDSLNGTKLGIKVRVNEDAEIENEDYLYGIEFWSEQFKDTNNFKITGMWNYQEDLWEERNSTGAIAELTDPAIDQKIYFLTDLDYDG